MSKRKYKPEEIIRKLSDAEVLQGQGATIGDVCRKIEVTKQTRQRTLLVRLHARRARLAMPASSRSLAPAFGCGLLCPYSQLDTSLCIKPTRTASHNYVRSVQLGI
jgi:hypothetical protein